MSGATSTYFQGGDYVELLSAQGKAPASTWKLQGKILKSFDKAIKGNAFRMDGSSETKMQLPKAPTASSSSLGLTQRFLVFQILVPHTRSFSVEIGFSDFQKIRRRLVFSSAFRETTMTALHVQIPLSSSVPRDQWMNFVFDLQALTEHFFSGSSFRSTESICISGSCRLKRIFTMKDAPYSHVIEARMHNQLAAYRQQRLLQVKEMASVPIGVAAFAEMKDIPKQFVFSIGTSSLPIPTEYFEVATENNYGSSVPAASVQARDRKATGAVQPIAGKVVQNKPTSANGGYRQLREKTEIKDRVRSAPTRAKMTADPDSEALATSHLAYDRGEEQKLDSGRRLHAVCRDETFNMVSSPAASARVTRSPSPARYSDEDEDPHGGSPVCSQKLPEDEVERASSSCDSPSLADSPLKQESEHFFFMNQSYEAAAALERRTHRQNVISQIQSRLDQLTQEAEEEEERDRELLKRRTPVLTNREPSNEYDRVVDEECDSDDIQHEEHSQRESTSKLWKSIDHEILRSPEPMVLKRAHARKKPVISFSSSIFTFGHEIPGKIDPNKEESPVTITKNLFDWDSLLQDTSLKKEPNPRSSASSATRSMPTQSQMTEPSSALSDRDGAGGRHSTGTFCEGEDDDDAELAALMKAKRQARRASEQRVDPSSPPRAALKVEISEAVLRSEVRGELQSSFDFSLSPLKENAEVNGTSTEDVSSPRSDASLSIDMTDRLEDFGPADPSIVGDKEEGETQSSEVDEEESFDFGELVAHTRNTQSPPRPSRASTALSELATEDTGSSRPVRIFPSEGCALTHPPSRHSARTSDQNAPRVSVTKSPLQQPTKANSRNEQASSVASSSQRRLASLLESTDWSQLPLSSAVASRTRLSTREATEAFSDREKHSSGSGERRTASSSIELIYDPILRCYYDPVGKKYYTLAK